jgi:hypothetical protein
MTRPAPIAAAQRKLTADDIAEELQVSRSKAYEIMHEIPHLEAGRRCLRVTRAAFDAWLRRREVPGCDSTSEATRGGRASTTQPARGSGGRRSARTGAQPRQPPLDSSVMQLIRAAPPRTRPRCKPPSVDS